MHVRMTRRRELIPSVVLFAALGLTAAFAWYAYDSGRDQDRLTFEGVAKTVKADVETRLDTYIAMLIGGAGLFAASEEVTLEEFRRYVERLRVRDRYPGIQGIGYARIIQPSEREAVLGTMRALFPEFRFWPDATPEAPFTAIIYLEPLDDRNLIALGYDMASNPVRADAMRRAAEEAQPATSGVVQLVQELHDPTHTQPGFLIYVPLYAGGGIPSTLQERRERLEGYVYGPFRADDLLKGIFPEPVQSVAGLRLYDGSPGAGGRLLHDRRWQSEPGRFTVSVETLVIAGRPWTLVLDGGESASRTIVILVLVGGTVLSLLLYAVSRGQVIARQAAERRADELRESEERLRAVDRAKDEFLATVSHELRTPLNAIVGWTSILRSRPVPPELHARAMNAIARNAAALTRLVEDLLDTSRAAAGHLSLRRSRVDVRATLQACVEGLQALAMDAGISLRLNLDPQLGTIVADPGRLQQIVTNLVSNSIKFTRPGGEIVLTARRGKGEVAVSVRDNGIGIDPAFMPFLFDRFSQADQTTTRAHGGTGLGLAIVHHLVQLHGGTIEARSDGPEQGATFTVRLPDSPQDLQAIAEGPVRDLTVSAGHS